MSEIIPEQMSKSAYAEHRGVHKSAVSHWIADGLISGEALTGTDRMAKIIVAAADAQLTVNLNMGQALGNAQGTLDGITGNEKAISSPDVYKQIKTERAALDLKQAIEADKEMRGFYVKAEDAQANLMRGIDLVVNMFEASIPKMADKLASKFELLPREVKFELKEIVKQVLEDGSKAFMQKMELEEKLIEDGESNVDKDNATQPSAPVI